MSDDPVFCEIVLNCGVVDCLGELHFPDPGEYDRAICGECGAEYSSTRTPYDYIHEPTAPAPKDQP